MTVPHVRWYHHVSPASARLLCEGEQHVVEWRRGKFVLHNHELSSERALMVLGGQPSSCLQALRMWREQFSMPPEYFEHLQSWLGANAVLAPKEMTVPRELGMALSWERAWHRSVYMSKHGKLIGQWLQERALAPFRLHLNAARQEFGARVVSGARVRGIPATEQPKVEGRMDSVGVRAEVALSSDWLVQVWARDMSVVDGAFVVAVSDDSLDQPGVLAVRWEAEADGRAKPAIRPASVTKTPDRRWTLAWNESGEAVS